MDDITNCYCLCQQFVRPVHLCLLVFHPQALVTCWVGSHLILESRDPVASAYAALAEQLVGQIGYYIVDNILEENLPHLVIQVVFRAGFDIHRQ